MILTLFFASGFSQKTEVVDREGESFIKGQLIAKIKEEHRATFFMQKFTETPIFQLLEKFDVTLIEAKFPRATRPRQLQNADGLPQVDLSKLYVIHYNKNISEKQAAKYFWMSGMFEYVEAQSVPSLLYTPNDPDIAGQYHLGLIQAFEAWDIQKGDTNVVIGITDTGIDTDHPELASRVKKNYNDPIDGVDNDNDGFVDNYFGWDTGSNDNDPEAWGSHGTKVMSSAAVNTDNGGQIAAVGFNTMVLPVKIANDNGFLVGAYDGIIYAADHGADIINCSWGGTGAFSQYHQDVVNYATNNKGALVVAAAGNSNATTYFYPASYDNVISVGGVTASDEKWVQSSTEGSQYNDKVDLVAPSHNIYGLRTNGSSGILGRGTSFAAPIVSGVAALVKAQYPDASPQKIAAILRATTDADIFDLPANQPYLGQMGTGRVNAFKALQEVNVPFITYHNHSVDDGFDQNLAAGDTVTMTVKLKNHLGTTNNVQVVLRPENNFAIVLDSVGTIASFPGGAVQEVSPTFKFVVTASASQNSLARFSILISDGTYDFNEAVAIQVNKDYVDINRNNLQVSFNNYGRIGYTFAGDGIGITYKNGSSLISDMGIMLGINETNVLSYEDYELLSFAPAEVNSVAELSGNNTVFTASGVLDDAWSMQPVGVLVGQTAYAWTSENNTDYVIYEFTIKNPTSDSLKDIYFGIFGDWAIGDKNNNVTAYDASRKMGYAFEPGGIYAGVKALRSNKVNYYGFNKTSEDEIDITDMFDDQEEFKSLSSGVTNAQKSGDVANVMSHGPYTVASNDSLVVAFALVAGDDLSNLRRNAQYAERMYEDLRGIKIGVNQLANLKCATDEGGLIDLSVSAGFPPYSIDWLNDTVLSGASVSGLAAGDYTVEVTDKYDVSKIMNLSISAPPLLDAELLSIQDVSCSYSKDGYVDFMVSGGSGGYYYNWGDPGIPSVQNPELGAGDYVLEISDWNGCKDSLVFSIKGPEVLNAFYGDVTHDTTNTCDGKVSIVASGGMKPYRYSWNEGPERIDNSFEGLCGGDYAVKVTDANGCEVVKDFTVLSNDEGEISTSTNQNIVKGFLFYPNPAKEYITAEFKAVSNEELQITVIDINGRVVQHIYDQNMGAENYVVAINTMPMRSGKYFLNIASNSGRSSFAFEVMN